MPIGKILESIISTGLGVAAALIIHYFIQTRAKKKENIWRGFQNIYSQINDKYLHNYSKTRTLSYLNPEVEWIVRRFPEVQGELNDFFNKSFNSVPDAQRSGESIIKKIEKIREA